MATRQQPDLEQWTQAIHKALEPLNQDMQLLKRDVADLRENRVRRDEIYQRDEIDRMLTGIQDEVKTIKEGLKEQRDSFYRVGAGLVAIMTFVILFAQHVHIS